MNNEKIRSRITTMALCAVAGMAPVAGSGAQTTEGAAPEAIGPGSVVVHTALGGFILGYDIDQNGNEGLLAEALTTDTGHDVAVETFDIRTGEIIRVVRQALDSKSDYVVLGIVGSHTGLVEFEHVTNLFVDARLYFVMNPLNANRFTARWTPPLTTQQVISGVSSFQGSPTTAVMASDVAGFNAMIFTSDVAANTFGTIFVLTDPIFATNNSPAFTLGKNQAVLGSSNGCPNCPTKIATVDLTDGTVTSFAGLGLGYVNGIAVDPETGIACTATEIDFSVEFYDLAAQTGIIRRLPGAVSQAQSGAQVQFDPVNKLFLIQQPMSSTAHSGSSIQIYDEQGNFVESINGLQLPVSPVTIALHPSNRVGYVLVTPDLTSLQSFRY